MPKSNYQNICDIYQTLYAYSDTLKQSEFQDGYDECLYQFMVRFKELPNVNLHVENWRLHKALKEKSLSNQSLQNKCAELRTDKKGLVAEMNKLQQQINLLQGMRKNAHLHKRNKDQIQKFKERFNL